MNEWERLNRQAQRYKKMYLPGTRLMLLHMDDPHCPVEEGTRGTVRFVDDLGTIHMNWDNGRSLGIVPDRDSFRMLTESERIAEQRQDITIAYANKVAAGRGDTNSVGTFSEKNIQVFIPEMVTLRRESDLTGMKFTVVVKRIISGELHKFTLKRAAINRNAFGFVYSKCVMDDNDPRRFHISLWGPETFVFPNMKAISKDDAASGIFTDFQFSFTTEESGEPGVLAVESISLEFSPEEVPVSRQMEESVNRFLCGTSIYQRSEMELAIAFTQWYTMEFPDEDIPAGTLLDLALSMMPKYRIPENLIDDLPAFFSRMLGLGDEPNSCLMCKHSTAAEDGDGRKCLVCEAKGFGTVATDGCCGDFALYRR